MSDVKKVVVAEIDINISAVIEKQKTLSIEIERQKTLQAEYKKAVKDGAEVTSSQTAEYIKSQATLKNLNAEYSNNTKLMANSEKATQTELGSRVQLQAQLTLMTDKWSKLSKAQRENTAEGQELSKSMKETTDSLKTMESGVGNNTRNVGNYSSALEGMEGRLSGAAGGLGGFASSLVASAKGGTLLKDSIGLINGAFKMLLANPIIAVIAGVVGIFMALKKVIAGNEDQTEKLNKALAPFRFALDAVMNVVQKLVDYFLDFGMAIGSATAAFLDFIGVQADSNETAKESIKLEERKQALQEKERDTLVKNAENELEFAKLRREATDKINHTAEERIELLKKADALESENSKREIANKKESLAILEKEAARNKNNTEINNKLAEAKKAVLDAEKNYYDTTFRLQKQLQAAQSEIEADAAAKRKAAAEERKKTNEAAVKMLEYELKYYLAVNESKLKDGVEVSQSLVDSEIDRLAKIQTLETAANDKAHKLGLKDKQEYKLQKLAIESEYQKGLEVLAAAELAQTKHDLDISIREFNVANQSKVAGVEILTEALVQEEIKRLEALRVFEEKKADLEITNAEELGLRKSEITQATNTQILALQKDFSEQQKTLKDEQDLMLLDSEMELKKNNLLAQFDFEREGLDKSYAEKAEKAKGNNALLIALEKEKAATLKDINRKELDAKMGLASGFAKDLAVIFGKQTKAGKAAGSAAVAIDTISGAMKAFNSFASIPGVGTILGAAAAAAVGVTGAKSIKDIWAVKETGETSSPSTAPVSGGSMSMPHFQTPQPNFDGGFASSQIGGTNTNTTSTQQVVLVVDDVTAKQMQINRLQQAATL